MPRHDSSKCVKRGRVRSQPRCCLCVVVVGVQGQDCEAVGAAAVVRVGRGTAHLVLSVLKVRIVINLPSIASGQCVRHAYDAPVSQDYEFRSRSMRGRRRALLRTAKELFSSRKQLLVHPKVACAIDSASVKFIRVPATRRKWHYHRAAGIRHLPRT